MQNPKPRPVHANRAHQCRFGRGASLQTRAASGVWELCQQAMPSESNAIQATRPNVDAIPVTLSPKCNLATREGSIIKPTPTATSAAAATASTLFMGVFQPPFGQSLAAASRC